MKTTSFDAEKMYTYLRGFATGREMKQTLAALSFALKYQTVSVVDAIDFTILAYESHGEE